MAKASPELRFQCLDLALKATTYKTESGLELAKRLVDFVEQDAVPAGKKDGTTARAAPKTAGKTAAKGRS